MNYDTKWVIHWTRRVSSDEYPQDVEPIMHDGTSAFESLLNILEKKIIYSTFSYRRGFSQNAGCKALVCTTDMPVSEFPYYSDRRDKSDTYGVALRKEEFIKKGGKSAIYGFNGQLPEHEKYRKVAIGFTHEREWRWESKPEDEGLLLKDFKVAVIVNTNEEAQEVLGRNFPNVCKVITTEDIKDKKGKEWWRPHDIDDHIDPPISIDGQAAFKGSLMRIYNGKCAISGVSIEAVLVAAHIVGNFFTGNASSSNGLLLRADLRNLFDAGLLVVDPDTLEISTVDTLSDTDYYREFHGKKLRDRVDGSRPSADLLRTKNRTSG